MEEFKFPLLINRQMEAKAVEDGLTKLRATNPSKKDETQIMLELFKWLTYDETRLNQFGRLINYIKTDNVHKSVVMDTFHKIPSLFENEYTLSFYTNVQKEKEIEPANAAFTLEQINSEFPCHPMNSTYNSNSPKFDPAKLFSLIKM